MLFSAKSLSLDYGLRNSTLFGVLVMILWSYWYQAISMIRPAFSRQSTFMWFVVGVMGLCVRQDNLGVTSIVRALSLHEVFYHALLRNFHSTGINLEQLGKLWVRCVFRIFAHRIERVNGRVVLLVDGKKIAKSGKKCLP